jgi:exodeoxyribonuclease III
MTFAFVFPGQGSQSVGMLNSIAQRPEVRAIMQEASDALGEDIAKLISEGPLTDTFRHFYPNAPHHYTWWSQRFPSVREKNLGWRIDYMLSSHALLPNLKSAKILPDAKHSDHCPMELILDFS